MKYSGATYVKITVREHPALYQLCVEDNGRGGTENMDKNTEKHAGPRAGIKWNTAD